MNSSEETLRTIASKYGLSSILSQIDSAETAEAMKIVFLGEFSSGKSSLINRLLGTKLPVGTKPTTKAVCIIHSSGCADTPVRYFRVMDDGHAQEIDWMDFDEAAQSNSMANTLAVEVPHSEFLPQNTMIVDTPGEGSLSAESAITMSYLAQVDAAVFCISAGDGTFHAHAREFIASETLRRAHGRMVFAVTMSDLKRGKTKEGVPEIEIVRNEIVSELKTLSAEGKFCADDIDGRVVCVSAAQTDGDGGISSLLKALQTFVYGKGGDVAFERRVDACRSLAASAAGILAERAVVMSLDADKFRSKMESAESDRKVALSKLEALRTNFDDFREKLPDRIGNAFDGHVPELVNAESPEDVAMAAQKIVSDIEAAVTRLANVKLGQQDWTIDHSFDSQIRASLPAAIMRIDKTAKAISDVAFIALSSGVAAAIPGGAAAAGGAARGAAAVAAKAGGAAATNAAAKTAVKRIASRSSEVISEVAKAAQKGGDTVKQGVDWANVLGKGAKILSKIMDSINPVSYIADWTVPGIKEKVIAEFRTRLVAQSEAMADMIWEEFDGLVLRPARQTLDERTGAVQKIRDDIESARRDFVAERRELEDDIATLKLIAHSKDVL